MRNSSFSREQAICPDPTGRNDKSRLSITNGIKQSGRASNMQSVTDV